MPLSAPWHLLTRRFGATVNLALKRYDRASFADVYPGVDAVYEATDGDLELDLVVHPGADADRVRIAANSGSALALEPATGDVIVAAGTHRYRLKHPTAYQWQGIRKVNIPVVSELVGQQLRFRLAAYDHTKPLTLDPLVAAYSTYIGSNTDAEYDNVSAVALDADGNIYLGGLTQFTADDTSFPTTPSSLDPANPRSAGANCANQCGYVVKLSPAHQVLYGALVYGATVQALAVDSQGSAYATGVAAPADFPTTPGVFSANPSGLAFAFKLTPDGSAFVYNALFIGDEGTGIAVDTQGDAYVVGNVGEPGLPTTPTTLKPAYQSTGQTINHDGFLLKINPSGSALVYGTYLGGSGADSASAVMVDSSGTATVTGQTASSDFVGLTSTVNGTSDAFIIQLAPDASRITNGRFIGGSADDMGLAVSTDHAGGYLLAGLTLSADFPVTAGAVQTHLLGNSNGWVARLDGSLDTLYATYLGGTFQDGLQAVTADANGDAYVAGFTYSADMPTSTDAFQGVTSAVNEDLLDGIGPAFYITPIEYPVREGYVAELDPLGQTLLYGSYLGGFYTVPRDQMPYTEAEGVTLDGSGSLYVVGETEAASFPVTDAGLRTGMGGQADGFLVQLAPQSLSVTTGSLLPDARIGQPYSQQLTASGGTPPYQWQTVSFELPNGLSLGSDGMLTGTPSNNQTEAWGYQFTAKVTDSAGSVSYRSLFVNVLYPGSQYCTTNACTITALVGQAFAFQIPTLARGVAPFAATISGSPPPGITVSPSGEIAGTPTTAGSYAVTVVETDSSGLSAALALQMTITGGSASSSSSSSSASPSTGGVSSHSGGGGGSLDPWTVLLLGALAAACSWRRHAARRSHLLRRAAEGTSATTRCSTLDCST